MSFIKEIEYNGLYWSARLRPVEGATLFRCTLLALGALAPFAVKLHKYSPSMPIIEWRDWVTPKGSQYGTKWVCATCSLISIIVNP